MANQIRIKRGLEANRSGVTPAEGELLYTTDEKKVYIGDGSTAGGILVTGSGTGTPGITTTATGEAIIIDVNNDVEITGDLTVNGFVLQNSAQFETTAGVTVGTGEVAWNPDEGTLDVGLLNGSVNQLGQEVSYIVKNQTGSLIPNGTAVMVTGTLGASGRLTIAPMVADGTVEAKYFIGVTTHDIADGEDGYVTHFGKVRGLNLTSFSDGDVLFVDPATPGGFIATEPSDGVLKLPTAFVIYNGGGNTTQGVLFVRSTQGSYLRHAHDVRLTNISTGDILVWDNENSEFINAQETDPVFNASAASGILVGDITNWNTAYGWGDHSTQGYLTDITGESIKDLSDVNSGMTPTDTQVLRYDNANSRWDASTLNDITTADAILAVANVTADMTGFPNRTDTTISFNPTTRTATIAPTGASASYWYRGTEFTFSTPKTFQIDDVTAQNYINIDQNGNLYAAGAVPGIRHNLLCMYVVWNATDGNAFIFGDERHSSERDTEWHHYEHETEGAQWRSGGGLTYTLNDDTATSIGVENLIISDEDLDHEINHSATPTANYEQILSGAANLPVLYRNGTEWSQITPSTDPWVAGTSLASYNAIDGGGSGSLTDASEGDYISYWMVATNDIYYPIKLILGNSTYASNEDAYGESWDSFGVPVSEIVPMYQIILQTSASYTNSTAKVVIADVRIITDRASTSSGAFTATSHDSLSGRSDANQHPISAITNLQTTLDAKEPSITKSTGYATWNGSAWSFLNETYLQDITGENIDSLSNVVISTPTNGQVLKYNGSNWVNGTDESGAGGGITTGKAIAMAIVFG